MIKRIVIFLILISFHLISLGNKIKGIIKDKDGNPLSFAYISVNDTEEGTVANDKGEYELNLLPGDYKLTASLIGYGSQTSNITLKEDVQTVNFTILIQSYTIDEVVVTANAEDPAIKKMRAVINQRKENQQQLQSLVTDIYLKGSMRLIEYPTTFFGKKITDSMKNEIAAEMGFDSTKKGIIYLLEQQTKYYYKQPNKEYNHILSVRTSGDSRGLGFASMPPIINIYDNNITILGGISPRGLISPSHSNAFWYYNFKFEGSYEENGKIINKIKVTPKRNYEPLFTGYVYVVENEWVFSAVDLSADEKSNIELLEKITLKQNYSKLNGNWIIVNQTIIPRMNFMGFVIGGEFLTNYTNRVVNQSIPDSIFTNKFLSTYDSNALKKDETYWNNTRQIPLTAEESTNFEIRDSIEKALDQKHSNSNKKYRTELDPALLLSTGGSIYLGQSRIHWNGIIPMLNFNHVEGLTISPDINYTVYRHPSNIIDRYNIELSPRYGFVSKKLYLKGAINLYSKSKKYESKNSSLSLEGGQYIQDINNTNAIPEVINTFYAIYGENHLKIYEKTFANIKYKNELGNGWNLQLSAIYEDRKPLENNTNWTWRNKYESKITPNNPIELPLFNQHQAFILNGKVSYQPGYKYIQYPEKIASIPSRAPIFTVTYTKGIDGILGSDVDFDKWSFDVYYQHSLKLLGNLKFRGKTGGFINSNKVGNPDFHNIIGNKLFYSSEFLNSFQLAPYYKYANTVSHYLQGHIEWHLNGFLTNKIPLFNSLNWHLASGSNIFYINQNSYYAEAFVGLENIGWKLFKLGRIDFIYGYESGVAKPNFGVRLGMSIGNMKFN